MGYPFALQMLSISIFAFEKYIWQTFPLSKGGVGKYFAVVQNGFAGGDIAITDANAAVTVSGSIQAGPTAIIPSHSAAIASMSCAQSDADALPSLLRS